MSVEIWGGWLGYIYLGDVLIAGGNWSKVINFSSFNASDWTILSNGWNYYWYIQNWYFYSCSTQSVYKWWFAYTVLDVDVSNYNIIEIEAVRTVWTIQTWSMGCWIYITDQQPYISGSDAKVWDYYIWDHLPMQSASWYNTGWLSIWGARNIVSITTNQLSSNTEYTTKAIFNLDTKTAEWFINWTSKWTATIPDSSITRLKNWWYKYLAVLWGDYSIYKSIKLTLSK